MVGQGAQNWFDFRSRGNALESLDVGKLAPAFRQAALLLGNVPLAAVLCKPDRSQSSQSSCTLRCYYVLFCTLIFVMRVLLQMSVFWSRGIPWKEVVFEAGGVIPLSVASMALGAASCPGCDGMLEGVGLALFVFGTWLNLYPEWQRHEWKKAGNNGKLYRGGLFKFARHINYTGELISFVGFSFATGALWTLWVPVVMTLGMCSLSIREIEFYLSQKYREDWSEYIEDVPWLMIPGVY